MKKFNPNKNIIITLIIVIFVVIVISLSAAKQERDGKTNIVQSVANDTVGFVDKVITAPVNWVRGGMDSIGNLFATYDENEKLKKSMDSYDAVVQENKDYEKQIEELKKQLEMTDTLSDYEIINTNVISRSPDNWNDTMVIDIGTKDGVGVNMAVMAKGGLVGRVIEVSRSTSKVELLTSDNQTSNHFPIKIVSKDGISYGLLEGYDEGTKQLVLTQITGEATISAGDSVQTSGLGGNSPANLIVGKVAEVKKDNTGLEKEVFVQSDADMYDISVVTVIKRALGEG